MATISMSALQPSHHSSSNSPNEPLLSSPEETFVLEGEETTNDSKNEKINSFNKAEYKIALSHFARIFSYSTRNDKLQLLAASVASIATGVTLPLMNVVFGELVGAFSAFYNPQVGETADEFTTVINRNVLYLVYLFIGRLVLDYVAILGFRMASIRISAAIRLAYLKALFSQPISVLDAIPAGQTAAIITITANTLQLGISEKLSLLLQSISLVITALVVAFYFNWLLTLVTSCGLIFIVVSYSITIPFLVRLMKEVEHADRMSSSIASEVFNSFRMVVACQAESKMAKRYSAWVQESRRRGLAMSPLVAFQQSPVFFAIHATFALSFWYAIKLYLHFDIHSVKTIIVILMSVMTIVMSIGNIAAPITAAAQAAGACAVFHTIIDAPQPKMGGVAFPDVSSRKDIVLQNINFAYPVRPDVKVLDDVNVTFPAGKVTAIVGPSGSGKSTIVGLLERWYELDGNMIDNILTLYFRNGMITIGGRNLYEIDLQWWRSQIGLVQQEPFLFNDTIYKNVEYGLIGTKWEYDTDDQKMELVKRACEEAFAHEFISRLPQGYDTPCGDAGIKLSGGQRQRIAIARGIVKRPAILILDEATSAMDVHGERIVQAALDKVSKDRTTIIIAHRLSTVQKADNIVVLKMGKVVQQGTHEQLMMDTEGQYWGLAHAQQLSTGGEYLESSLDIYRQYWAYTHTQQLSMDPEYPESSPLIDREGKYTNEGSPYAVSNVTEIETALDPSTGGAKVLKHRFLSKFTLFLWEQKPQWRWYTVMFLGALGAGASFPIQSFLFAKLISLFDLWGQYLQDQTSFWCLMFTFLAFGVGISYFILGWSSNVVAFNITATYRQEYFENALSKPVSYYDEAENSVGSLTARMATDPTQLQQLLGINMAIVLISFVNIVGCVAMSFVFGWKLTLITVCSAMPIILAAGFFRLRYEIQFEKMNHAVFEQSSKFATESISAFRTVSSLTLECEIIKRYEELLRNHTAVAFQKALIGAFVFATSDSISLLCMAFVLWYGGKLLSTHEYTTFQYLVVYLAIVQGSTSAGQSLSFGPNIAQAFAAAERIQNMRPQDEPDNGDNSLDLDGDEKSNRGIKIELKNVWFQYPTRDVPVLRGVNMTIEKGQFVAIVGPSGSGKTSIISLLERFYHMQKGSITCYGTNIQNIPLGKYRKHVSLVAQEASIFEGSIRENILLGVNETEISNKTLHQICRDAGIHDFIVSLPEGYETAVGSKGVALSGGQKQRLSIARALIRDPQVLLLDEATSNLDPETERSIQAVFEKTAKDRTMIVVAHRLATIQNADVIFVVGDGVIVEKGDHTTLLRNRGLYYQMCQSQALGH